MALSDITIDKEGLWHYCGAHMFRKDILCIFFENLHLDKQGRYFIQLKEETCFLDVADTAIVVVSVFKMANETNGREWLEVLLSDDSREKLDLSSLSIGADNVMYCQIKNGKFPARFTRKSYYQLAEFIEPDNEEDKFCLCVAGDKYTIKDKML